MQFGVISDTHDNVAAIERATDVFEAAGVEVVVHCGDFVAPPVLPFFDGLEVHGVLGNNASGCLHTFGWSSKARS